MKRKNWGDVVMIKKSRIVKSTEEIDKILSNEILVGFSVWSDGSATLVIGYKKEHIEVGAELWEEFNLRHDIFSY